MLTFKIHPSDRYITLESQLIGTPGKEGHVHGVRGEPLLAAKVYKQPSNATAHKLRAMIGNPLKLSTSPTGFPSLAWPTELLMDKSVRGGVAGFVMPKALDSMQVYKFYIPKLRQSISKDISYAVLTRIATNLAAVVGSIHTKGYVIGDLNESNILVNREGWVCIIDTDSFQIKDSSGYIHRSVLGKEEFIAPELVGADLGKMNRTVDHDSFALAVLIYRLLMHGMHPFEHKNPKLSGLQEKIKAGFFPHGEDAVVEPLPYPSFTSLDPQLQSLFIRCFREGHRHPIRRPSPQEWMRALRSSEKNLVRCRSNTNHMYNSHLLVCPWCNEKLATNYDFFLGKKPHLS